MTLDQMSFLLAVVSAVATLAGLILVIYGYYNVHRAERIIDAKLERRVAEVKAELAASASRAQEAMQKIMSAYSLSSQGNHEGAIALLEAAVAVDPKAFNGYTALGYEYWAVRRVHEAIECFHKAVQLFPERPEPYNDLARIYAKEGEDGLALRFIGETLKRKPTARAEIDRDEAFAGLKARRQRDYEAVIGAYR